MCNSSATNGVEGKITNYDKTICIRGGVAKNEHCSHQMSTESKVHNTPQNSQYGKAMVNTTRNVSAAR